MLYSIDDLNGRQITFDSSSEQSERSTCFTCGRHNIYRIKANLLLCFVLGQKRHAEQLETICCSKYPRIEDSKSDAEGVKCKPLLMPT